MANKVRVPQVVRDAIGRYVRYRAMEFTGTKGKARAAETITPWFAEQANINGGKFTIETKHGEAIIQSTWVQPESEVLDEDKLREIIGVKDFNRLTTMVRTFDQDKFAKAVKDGTISADVLAQVLSVHKGTGYTKHTVK